ncbi:MAG: response regulator [Pseudomonadota bacterium]
MALRMADNDNLTGISIAGIPLQWNRNQGTCTFSGMPVIMMWVDSTLAGLMAGVQAMVGTERFSLALQSEGRKSIVDDWRVISSHQNFSEGFQALARVAATAGWGNWQLVAKDQQKRECIFRVSHSWEGKYQQSLGVNWGCSMLAGKLAGYCSRLFDTSCWAEQTSFTATGDSTDTFIVSPSTKTIEEELDNLLGVNAATGPDMVVALKKLQEEIRARTEAEQTLRRIQLQLEQRIQDETADYRESERKYRNLEQDYQNLFTKMLDGFALHEIICQKDKPVDYRFLSVNPAFETLTGLAAKDILGKTAREVLPNLEPYWIEMYGKVALSGEPVNFEQHAPELDKHFQIAAYCPAPGQFACIFQDVTLRKKAEQEKVALEAQLRRRHKMEAIGTLAGGIAHDFNNILAAILGYAEMALEEIPTWSQANSQIQEVLKAGTRAKNLVRQILAFSHREDQNREPVNLNALITEVVVFLRATIPTTIDILLDLAPNCGNILGDPTQIHQVLMNLCTNAGQAMETDGGTLAITLRKETFTDEVKAQEATPRQGTFVRLDIADTGSGIPENCLERIFDPYFTTKEFGKGSGMGLAVVQGIVKSHDGLIKVVNNPEKGVTFSLSFPSIDAPARPVETEELAKTTGSERILVVDDEPSIARMLEIVLKNNGYAVQTLSSSTKALEIFRADPSAFDLLLTDMTMPDLAGDNLALAIHQLRIDIPIILCTGYSSRIDELQAREVGVQAFLMKPVDFKELTSTVRRLLDNNQE